MAERIKDAGLMTILRDTRTAGLEKFKDAIIEFEKDDSNDGHDILMKSCAAAIDQVMVDNLNTVFNHPRLFIEEQYLEKSENSDELKITTQFVSGLADLYMQEVSN